MSRISPIIFDTEFFFKGACTKDPCLLSHQLQMDKMPACKFFLEGLCTKENCPYLHVKVKYFKSYIIAYRKGG